ncbi:MAG: hypothetical protein Q8926_13865 [Bacteroidota bacterium]|nr:hypothetical protein [Bacteroidota bacterium]
MIKDRFQRCKRWAILSLLNFVLVSLAGVLLRYKIAFSLPIVNYKYLLNAHSHFAFAGWVSMALFTAFVYMLSEMTGVVVNTYRYQFRLGQIANFGMLISFIVQGYAAISISFSVLSIIFSYWFAWQFGRDLVKSRLSLLVKYFAGAALFFYVISSIGPFLLGYILSHKIHDNNLYFNAIYLFLHFQYNGWFSFGILAIFFHTLHSKRISFDGKKGMWVFGLLFGACIPAYCLSLLWTSPPLWVFVLAGLAGLAQCAGAVMLLQLVVSIRQNLGAALTRPVRIFWTLSLFAFSVKILLQGLSVVPLLGRFAFGIRPVIIGYLHLVFLGFISFFLIGFYLLEKLYVFGRMAMIFFIAGVLANEVFLLLQGVYALAENGWGNSGVYLLGASLSIFTGLSLFLAHQFRRSDLADAGFPV